MVIKKKTQKIMNVSENVEKLEHADIASGNGKGAAIVLVAPRRVGCDIIIWPKTSTSCYTPKWTGNMFTKISMCVYGRNIHNTPKVEVTQNFICWWRDKQYVVYP